MGAFQVRLGDRTVVLPNVLHDEGAQQWLRRCFPDQGTAPTSFKIGISGLNTDFPSGKPNPTEDTSSEDQDYATLRADGLNPDGGFDARMRGLLDMEEQTVTFSVSQQSGGVRIATGWYEFANAIEWAPTSDSWYENEDPPLTPPYPWKAKAWETPVGFPWHIPRVAAASLYDPPGDTVDAIADNLMLGATFPIGCFYIRTSTSKLLVSAVPKAPMVVRPGGSLWVKWVGRLCPSLEGETT